MTTSRRRLPWLRIALGVYSALLLASTVVRLTGEDAQQQPDGQQSMEIPAPDGKDTLRIAWMDSESAEPASEGGLPLILLHGSPGSAGNFNQLRASWVLGRFAEAVGGLDDPDLRAADAFQAVRSGDGEEPAEAGTTEYEFFDRETDSSVRVYVRIRPGRRTIAPDLPGFGASDHRVADYSSRGHADSTLKLLDRLDIERFHVLGFSMGGAVALHLADQAPERVASVILMSSIGVQELELLGDYRVNHGLHGLPHRCVWSGPQSHCFLFRGGGHLAARIEDCLSRVEGGEAAAGADAEAERLRRAALPFDDLDLPPFTGPALLIVFLLLVFAAYASEDLTCITAGLLVAQGRLDFPVAVAACYAGILSSDLGIAWLARVLGRPALRLPPFKWWVSEARFEEASAWLRRRALVVVLVSRFLPGTRLPTCLAAGILRTSLLRFCFYFALAVAIWTPAFVGVNALLGREAVERFDGRLPGGLLGAALALAVVIFIVRSVVVPLFTWRGRRLWRGRLLRIRHWEFWPMWAFYPPLALYILWQGLRRGSLTAFTAINPAMPLGGLLGESKSDILDGLHGIGDALPAWRRLPPGSPEGRVAALRDFLEDRNLDYPVVLKPDTGERGRGVAVARSEADVAAFFKETPGPALAQEYVAGEEYGVFWARHPGRREGHVFSITHKVRPTVSGDGTSTLERLILDDARAVAIAHIYRREHPGAATYVPAAGEGVELTEVGAHSRGTIFLDANDLHTPELEQAMNAICTAYDGFDFGRLDVRVPSAEALRRGESLRVLEVNGVTSEATHMYDPRYGFFAAHAILRRQWAMAFDLAAERIREGVQPTTVSEIARAVRAERRARRGAA